MAEVYFAFFVCAFLASGCGMLRLYDDFIHKHDIANSGSYGEMTLTSQCLKIIGPLSLGVVIGASVFTFVAYWQSRKLRLVVVAIPAIIASVIYVTHVWDGNFDNDLKGGSGIRFFHACTIGAAEALLPVYLGEISRNVYRGIFCISMAVWSQIGVIVVDIILHATNSAPVEFFVAVGAVVLIFYTIVVPFIPNSPYYLATIRPDTKVHNGMIGLFGSLKDEEVKEVLEHTAGTEKYTGRLCGLFSDRGSVKAFWIMFLLAVCSELSGASLAYFMEYSVDPIPQLGGKDSHVIISLTKLAGIVLVVALIDLVGRRIMICVSGILGTLCVVGVTLLLAFRESLKTEVEESPTYISALLVVYIFSMSIGIRTVPLVLISELFPTSERLTASGLFVVIKQVLFFAITVLHYTYINKNVNYIVFAVYAVILIVCSNVVLYLLPETKGQSFDKIQASLRKRKDGGITEDQDAAVQKPDGPAPQNEQSDSPDAQNEQSDSPDAQNEQSDSPDSPNQLADSELPHGMNVSFELESSVSIKS